MGNGKWPKHTIDKKQTVTTEKNPPHGKRGAPVGHKGGVGGSHGGGSNR